MDLIVAPLHETAEALARWKPSHVVSLASPGAETLAPPGDAHWLPLTFHDIADARPRLTLVSDRQIRDLLAFARSWDGRAPLLIHCWAGVSRSPATAYAVACALSEPGAEEAWASCLRAAAPFATPNRRIVEAADALLSRDGRMVKAIAGIGRGEEVAVGRTFRLPRCVSVGSSPTARTLCLSRRVKRGR